MCTRKMEQHVFQTKAQQEQALLVHVCTLDTPSASA